MADKSSQIRDQSNTNQHNQAFVLSASMAEMNEAGELCIDTITSSFVLQVNQLKTKGGSDGVSYTVLNPMCALVEVGVFFSFLYVITKEYPFCAFALVEMHMTAVAKLMRNAESKGNSGEAVEYFSQPSSLHCLFLQLLTRQTMCT